METTQRAHREASGTQPPPPAPVPGTGSGAPVKKKGVAEQAPPQK